MSFSEHVADFSEHMAKNSHRNMKRTSSTFFNTINVLLEDRKHRNIENTIVNKKSLAKTILKNTARTVDTIKYNIEKSVIDYTSAPEKHILETDEYVIVHLSLPGVKKEDIGLKITEKELKIKASFDISQQIENRDNIAINDSKTGVFKRSLKFPKKVMPKEAEATFKNGVLTVEAPKVDRKESFKVEIK